MAQQIIIKGTPVVAANEVLVADSNSKIPAVDGSAVTTMAGGNITGTIPTARLDTGTTANKLVVVGATGLPAVDGSLLTGIVSHTTSASDPAIDTNPSGGVGSEWINSTSGKQFICTDATAGENVWTCSGGGTTGDVAPASWMGGRALCLGGYASGYKDEIDYWTIATLGNATDFGNLTNAKIELSGCSGGTRGLAVGGYKASPSQTTDEIEYVTISTPGNGTDFGNLTTTSGALPAALSNGYRGVRGGGYTGSTKQNTIDYITIATPGNAIDFGDMTRVVEGAGPMSNATRGVFGGGKNAGGSEENIIEYITIATLGNGTDFGDSLTSGRGKGVVASATRGVMAGGYSSTNVIDYITIATTSNALDFGDLVTTLYAMASGNINSTTRGCFAGGNGDSTVIQYITIATLGNSIDFGDLTVGRHSMAGCAGD